MPRVIYYHPTCPALESWSPCPTPLHWSDLDTQESILPIWLPPPTHTALTELMLNNNFDIIDFMLQLSTQYLDDGDPSGPSG